MDYLSYRGHRVFNSIQVNSILSLGHYMVLVGKEGYFSSIPTFETQMMVINIPNHLFFGRNVITARFSALVRLMWCRKRINLKDIDLIIVPTYDILSFFFFRVRNKVLIVNHNNVDQLDSLIKLHLTKRLSSNYSHIALNDYMLARLKTLMPDKDVFYVPHGYLEPSMCSRRPPFVNEAIRFVFCPVNRNHDIELIERIIKSKLFNRFLEEENLLFFLKPQLCSEPIGNIKVIDVLDDDEYNYMLNESKAIILPYGNDFKYRCSGILFECVARNVPIIATDREALKIYQKDIDIRFFNSVEGLVSSINSVLRNSRKEYSPRKYMPGPYWEQILSQ